MFEKIPRHAAGVKREEPRAWVTSGPALPQKGFGCPVRGLSRIVQAPEKEESRQWRGKGLKGRGWARETERGTDNAVKDQWKFPAGRGKPPLPCVSSH